MDQVALKQVAELLAQRNLIDEQIARVIGRPATTGHIGEWIAAQIFGVELHGSAINCGSDGLFTEPPLAGRSVNVKFYPKREGNLDMKAPPDTQPDFYLVLAGPKRPATTSRNSHRPCVISEVFLFEAAPLVQQLANRGVQIGGPTSVTIPAWEAARIHPHSGVGAMPLSQGQVAALTLFGGASPILATSP